jgi:hypothetical protein
LFVVLLLLKVIKMELLIALNAAGAPETAAWF